MIENSNRTLNIFIRQNQKDGQPEIEKKVDI